MEIKEFLHKSPKLNQIPKPGTKSQLKMAPPGRTYYEKTNTLRFAATVMLFYPINTKIHFCLIRRTLKTTIHSNQVCFPGGEKEKSDKNYWNTGLREMNEEIGVKQDQVVYITELSKLFIPVSNFIVFPYMARIEKRPSFLINDSEVEYLIEVKLSMLLSKDSIGKSNISNRKVPIFNFKGEHVWGATAMILAEARDLFLSLK